jgi:cobalamin-dependent methionine synthase I
MDSGSSADADRWWYSITSACGKARYIMPCLAAQVDWAAPENQPHKPQLIGTKVYDNFPLEDVLEYIDWNPFFQVQR